jgi:hypothetical protein
MDNIKYLTKNTKDELMKEIMSHIDQGYIPVGNLETIKKEESSIPEGYDNPEYPSMTPQIISSTTFTQTMYKPKQSFVSSGGSYKNNNKKKNKTKTKN